MYWGPDDIRDLLQTDEVEGRKLQKSGGDVGRSGKW